MTDPVKATILILENDEPIRLLAEAVLELSLFEVCSASTIEEAAPLLGEIVPDAVVIDLELPDHGAQRAITALRAEREAGVRLIGIAGADQVVGDPSGCDAVLRKPGALALLPGVLEVLIRERDARASLVPPLAAVGDKLFIREGGDAVGLVRAVSARSLIASVRREDVVLPLTAVAAAHHGKLMINLGAIPKEARALLQA